MEMVTIRAEVKRRSLAVYCFCFATSILAVFGCGAGGESFGRKVIGGVEVKEGQIRGRLPQRAPRMIYVGDFTLDAESYKGDEGPRGALPGRLGQRLPHPLQRNDAPERARQIVETMAESLVRSLREKGLAAQRLYDKAANLQREGWLVQGLFTELDEGNRLKRAAIGFGKGETRMDLQVALSDLESSDPRAAFAIFGSAKDPRHIPGAVVAMNPYVAAAKFVLQKNATEKDIHKTAEQIADRIAKYAQQIS
jgi:hypothetical protein